MLRQLIMATAAMALVAAPASARHRHHRYYEHRVYSYAVPWIGYGNWYRPYGYARYQPYNWARWYSHHRDDDWDYDEDHHRHWGWYDNGEDNDDQGEDD